jgi:hypothetical protein
MELTFHWEVILLAEVQIDIYNRYKTNKIVTKHGSAQDFPGKTSWRLLKIWQLPWGSLPVTLFSTWNINSVLPQGCIFFDDLLFPPPLSSALIFFPVSWRNLGAASGSGLHLYYSSNFPTIWRIIFEKTVEKWCYNADFDNKFFSLFTTSASQ